MFAFLAKPIDWLAIELALPSVRSVIGPRNQADAVKRHFENPQFLFSPVGVPNDLTLFAPTHFRFTSPITSPWPKNNVVPGRFYRSGENWKTRPTVILVHGWNGEMNYFYLFPWLGHLFRRRGINTLFWLLPYHATRKPHGPGVVRNFISDDLERVIEATHQSIAEARALAAWLRAQGCLQLGLWGFSLGGWLAGLVGCSDTPLNALALTTPVPKMSRAIHELAFGWPLKQALAHSSLELQPFDLANFKPTIARDKILLQESTHDLFAPPETVEELWRAWHEPEIWRLPHGHISVLLSAPVMKRTVNWVAGQLETGPGSRRG